MYSLTIFLWSLIVPFLRAPAAKALTVCVGVTVQPWVSSCSRKFLMFLDPPSIPITCLFFTVAVTLKKIQSSKSTSRFTPSFWEQLPTETQLCWKELKSSSVCWSSLRLGAVCQVAVPPDPELSLRTLSVPSHPGAVLSTRCWVY